MSVNVSLSGRLYRLKAIAVGVSISVLSMSAGAAKLEEVIVTAQKRAQNLQDVPVSVSAIGGEKIEAMNVKRLDELTAYTPGVTVIEGNSGAQLFIRGVGSGLNKGFEESVGTYIDGVYFGRGRSSRNAMFDLDRAEILKGPQGILFGKNTIAGAINMTTKNPGDELEGYVKAGYEFSDDEQVYEAAYGGPLTDTFGARLAVKYSTMNGWMRNTFTGKKIGAEEDVVARLTTTWLPIDAVEVITKLQYSKLKQSEKPAQLVKCSPALLELIRGVDNCRYDDKTTVTAYDPDGGYGGEELESTNVGVTVNWDLDRHTITSVTGFTKYIDDLYIDSDMTHHELLESVWDEEYKSYSQEFRIASHGNDRLDYLAGFYYEKNNLKFDHNMIYDQEPLTGSPYAVSRVTFADQDTETIAIFGQFSWYINDYFSLTLGGRYSKDEKDAVIDRYCADYRTYTVSPNQSCLGFPFLYDVDRRDEDFSPSVTLEWHPNPDHMLYAKYSEGYKSGGIDIQTSTGDYGTLLFDPEEVKSFELGSKSTLLDGAMTLNMALFRNEYKDLQVSTFDGLVGFNVGNAAESVSQGMEVDIAWAITRNLRTSLSFSYLDATYDKFPAAQCSHPQTVVTPPGEVCTQDLSGKTLQFAPRRSGHYNLTWNSVVMDGYLLEISGDIVFTDRYYISNDLDRETRHHGYYKLDARVALSPLDGPWRVALVGKNLNDKQTHSYATDVPLSPGSYFRQRDRARTVALDLSWNF